MKASFVQKFWSNYEYEFNRFTRKLVISTYNK